MASTRSFIVYFRPPGPVLFWWSYIAERRAGLGGRFQNQRAGAVGTRRCNRSLALELYGRTGGLAGIGGVGFGRVLRRLRRAPGTRACRSAAVDVYHRALDEDSSRVDVYEVPADFERERRAG